MVARIEATPLGLDIRYIVTSLAGTAKHLYETVYCARGQAENFIKLHKAQLASDRTSCRDPRANQMRLILHTAAYWLLHTLRAAAPKRSALGAGGVQHAAPASDQDRRARRRRQPRAFASGCRPLVPTARPSSCSLAASPPLGRERWGTCAPLNPSRNPLTAKNQIKMSAAEAVPRIVAAERRKIPSHLENSRYRGE